MCIYIYYIYKYIYYIHIYIQNWLEMTHVHDTQCSNYAEVR